MLLFQFLLLMQAEHVNTFRKLLNHDMNSLVLNIIIHPVFRHSRSVSVLPFHLLFGQPPILLHLSNTFKVIQKILYTFCVRKTLT